MIRDYEEGAKVVVTDETIKIMEASSKSVATMFPSQSYINVAKRMKGIKGTVSMRFKPGYEFNVEWPEPYIRDDGTIQDVTILQMKDNWVEPLDKKWKKI